MTSEQIIKAMICCTNFPVCDRDNCPYGESTNCATMLGKDVVELINRQKAEIERLKKLLAEEEEKYNLCAKRFYTEAIKEFAERLKNKILTTYKSTDGTCIYEINNSTIDNLVKEMVGDTE